MGFKNTIAQILYNLEELMIITHEFSKNTPYSMNISIVEDPEKERVTLQYSYVGMYFKDWIKPTLDEKKISFTFSKCEGNLTTIDITQILEDHSTDSILIDNKENLHKALLHLKSSFSILEDLLDKALSCFFPSIKVDKEMEHITYTKTIYFSFKTEDKISYIKLLSCDKTSMNQIIIHFAQVYLDFRIFIDQHYIPYISTKIRSFQTYDDLFQIYYEQSDDTAKLFLNFLCAKNYINEDLKTFFITKCYDKDSFLYTAPPSQLTSTAPYKFSLKKAPTEKLTDFLLHNFFSPPKPKLELELDDKPKI